MKNWDDVVEFLKDKKLISKNCINNLCNSKNCCTKKESEKNPTNVIVWVLAIVGAVAAVAAIAYAVYRYMTPDYLDDFDDDFDDDFEDDFFDDEEDEPADKKTE